MSTWYTYEMIGFTCNYAHSVKGVIDVNVAAFKSFQGIEKD